MTTREFVEKLFSDCREGAETMTIEEAEADIRNFNADGWELPDDITAEEYMEIWNELVNKTTLDGMADLQVLLSIGMSERDAKRHLENGTSVFRSINQWADAQKANGYWDGLVEEAETDDPNLMIERLGDREITSDGYVIEYVL